MALHSPSTRPIRVSPPRLGLSLTQDVAYDRPIHARTWALHGQVVTLTIFDALTLVLPIDCCFIPF
jgi:hypothetical protein